MCFIFIIGVVYLLQHIQQDWDKMASFIAFGMQQRELCVVMLDVYEHLDCQKVILIPNSWGP